MNAYRCNPVVNIALFVSTIPLLYKRFDGVYYSSLHILFVDSFEYNVMLML